MTDTKLTEDGRAFLRDKLQSWPGEMALTSTDVADLLALLDERAEAELDALKAEVERLTISESFAIGRQMFLEDCLKKAGAEVERLKDQHHIDLMELRAALKAEAELEAAERTIEELMKAWELDRAELDAARPSTNVGVKCCRCAKETLFYVIAPYGSRDDGDPVCAECLDRAKAEGKEKG
jgi:hypothetical protein